MDQKQEGVHADEVGCRQIVDGRVKSLYYKLIFELHLEQTARRPPDVVEVAVAPFPACRCHRSVNEP